MRVAYNSNVTAAGGIAVCKALLDKGVLRGADALLAAVLPFVAAEQTDDRPKALDFLEQLVAVLWALWYPFVALSLSLFLSRLLNSVLAKTLSTRSTT